MPSGLVAYAGRRVNGILRQAGLHVTADLRVVRSRSRVAAADDHLTELIRYAMRSNWSTVDRLDQFLGLQEASTCALCGYEGEPEAFVEYRTECWFDGGTLVRHQCPECDVIFGPQKMLRLDAVTLDLEYRMHYATFTEGETSANVLRAFRLLQPSRQGTYLDFGCGERSDVLEGLRGQGWDVFGFEPSAHNPSPLVLTKWDQIAEMRFDGIFSNNVLEHLFDPAGITSQLGSLLKPGGRIVYATPCFDYCYEYTRFHVFFFTGRSPEVLARLAGMRIVGGVRDGAFIACVMEPRWC